MRSHRDNIHHQVSRCLSKRRWPALPTLQLSLVEFQAILGGGSDTCAAVVPRPRPVLKGTIARHTSGGVGDGTKHGRAGGSVFPNRNQNGQAHLRRWVSKALALRKTRAIETPVAPADIVMGVTAVQGAVKLGWHRSDRLECVCLVGLTLPCSCPPTLHVSKITAVAGHSDTPESREGEAHRPPPRHSREA